MKGQLLPLATSSWDHREIEAIHEVIASNQFTMSDRVKKYETEFAEKIGSRFCIMVNSGSSANLLAVGALRFSKSFPLHAGDEVIVPAVSWSTTFAPLQQYGLKVKFVDIDRQNLNLDLDRLSEAITSKTRAIFCVNLLGNSIAYRELENIIKGRDILLLEDNCESLGATFEGKNTGTFGLLGTFSSFFSHHISTMEGGMIATEEEELYEILLSLRAHGWTRDLKKGNSLIEKNKVSFYDSFRFVLPGYNLRPLEFSGAVGSVQLSKLDEIVDGRRRNAREFQKLFADKEGIRIQKETGDSSWFGFAIIIEKLETARDELVQILESKGVECRPIVSGNFVRNAAVKYFDYEVSGALENSDELHDNGFFIGNQHYDITSELRETEKIISSFLHK